ncbi:MAG: hypothetical protein QNL33_20060 [Akkermansiaceae bacterium]|jgi:hypothetical protein
MKIKQALGLIIGLIVGVVGGVLYSNSVPPEEGSVEDEYELAVTKLASAERRLMAFSRYEKSDAGRTRDALRDLAKDFKDGKEVSPDDVFATMKPWLREMAPIFERIREVNAEDWANTRTSEWARLYGLSQSERERLEKWFQARGEERAKDLTEVVQSQDSGFVDFIKATEYNWRDASGVEPVIEEMLEGEDLARFREDRLAERAESVQNEADRNLTRLDDVVGLDDDQHRELFGVLSRSARDYRPEVGVSGEAALDLVGRDTAINEVLRPDQLEVLNEHRSNRQAEAEKELRRLGMTLPENWDALERESF